MADPAAISEIVSPVSSSINIDCGAAIEDTRSLLEARFLSTIRHFPGVGSNLPVAKSKF